MTIGLSYVGTPLRWRLVFSKAWLAPDVIADDQRCECSLREGGKLDL